MQNIVLDKLTSFKIVKKYKDGIMFCCDILQTLAVRIVIDLILNFITTVTINTNLRTPNRTQDFVIRSITN